MLLHHSPVNERREAQGLPRVNSLWFWGAGALPQAPRKPPFSGVSANCVLARGLARWSGVRLTEVPEGLFAWPSEDRAGDWLVILGDLRRSVLDADLSAWAEALHRLEQGWFAPMSSWLRQNPSCRVFLYPASGDRFAVSARLLRRCWRRSRPLMGYLRGEDRERLFL